MSFISKAISETDILYVQRPVIKFPVIKFKDLSQSGPGFNEAFCSSKNLTSSIKLNFISMFNKQKENMKMKKVKRYLQDAAAYHAKF